MQSVRLSELASEVGGTWEGDHDPLITGAAGLSEAGPGQISFCSRKELEAQLAETGAAAVIIRPGVDCQIPCLRVEEPYRAFATILKRFDVPLARVFPEEVHPTAVVHPEAVVAEGVALGPYTVIGAGARIGTGCALGAQVTVGPDVEIGPDCLLYPQVTVREGCVLGRGVIVHAGTVIGSDGFGFLPGQGGYSKIPQIGRVVIEDEVEIGANCCIDRATTGQTVIGAGTKIDNLVQVAHNVTVGRHSVISAQTGLSGSCQVGDGVAIGGQVGVKEHVWIGDKAQLGAQSGIMKEVPAGQSVFGSPALEIKQAFRLEALLRRLPELFERLRKLEKSQPSGPGNMEDSKVVRLQKTISRPVSLAGMGLHTGCQSQLTFKPAPANSGIRFRVRAETGEAEIPALVENVRRGEDWSRNTTLGKDEVTIHTVEHVLACLAGCGITNCLIELEGSEPPEPPDGSVLPYVELLETAGWQDQGLPALQYPIPGRIYYQDGDVEITATKADSFLITFAIDYEDPLIGVQEATFEIRPDVFRAEIAPARTFVLHKDVSRLQALGLARGGTLQNAVVIEDGKLVGGQKLRFPNEFVRHKILDLLGDLSLLGMPLQGHITARRSGHAANVAFTRLLAQRERRMPRIYPPREPQDWDIGTIMEIMPHRYPFLLIDRIVELEPGKRAVGIKNVTINEPFFQGHFPGHPIMPAVLIIEAMAQTGGVLLLSSVDDPKHKLVYFSGIDRARFRQPVTPGDQLRFELEMVKLRGPICKMHGVAYVEDERIAEADLMSNIVER